MTNLEGEKFLDKIYQDLYMSDFVQHTKDNKDTRLEAIKKYMDRLEELHNMADSEEKKKYVTRSYFRKYVIKKENIPYGADKKAIINAQEKSLKLWVNYLMDPTTTYPMWAKYWAFQGMLKMGTRDEAKETYFKRDEKTIAPFVDANPEIIASCIDFIVKSVNGDEIDDEELNKLNKMDSFNKIYSYFEKKFKNNVIEKSNSSDGIWVKYNQGSREDAIKLNKETANKNTGWCTASSEDMAINQVCGPYNDAPNGGDFYVYYTKDKNGEYKIPRIAIRLIDHDEIGEIRGVEEGQNLEEDMISILEQQLKSMKNISKEDIEENLQIVNNLRKLTKINIKTSKNEDLTEDELIDLYTKRYGFGYQNDPRVERIIKKRNTLNDFNNIKDISTKVEMILSEMLPPNSVSDREIVLEAVKQGDFALEYVFKELRNDREFVLAAVKRNGCALDHTSDELRNDREIVLEAVKQYGYALDSASDELRNDREIVLEAVKQKGIALYCASDELRNDREIVLEAVKQDGRALHYASEELRNDADLIAESNKTLHVTNIKTFKKIKPALCQIVLVDQKLMINELRYRRSK